MSDSAEPMQVRVSPSFMITFAHFSLLVSGTMFGEGSYLAEDAGKCDHYTGQADREHKSKSRKSLHLLHDLLYEGADDHPGDVCYLLVCRVRYSFR